MFQIRSACDWANHDYEDRDDDERDQGGALKEPLKEFCTGGSLECMFDVQLEHDVLRVRFEDKLREAAGSEAAVGCRTRGVVVE